MKLLTANKDIADALKSWLGVIGILFAGAYSLLEYIEHKKGVKVERSLSYVEHYRDSSTTESKLFLNQLLADNHLALAKILNAEYENETALNNTYNKFIVQITDKPSVQRNLEIAFSFFEEVAICVERDLCDQQVINSFFANDAKALFNSFSPYVCSLRQQWKNNTVYLKLEQFYVQPEKDICS